MTGNNYKLSRFVGSVGKSDPNNIDFLDGNVFKSDDTSVFPEFKDYDNLKDLLRRGEKELAKYYIEEGCRLNKDCTDYSYDSTPLHLAVSLEYPDIVELLLEKGADTESLNDTQDTPLILASIVGNSEIIDIILSKSVPKNYSNRQSLSHFHIACMRNNVDIVQKLLFSGADVNEPVKEVSMFWPGFTPLHFAIEFRSVEVAKLLIDSHADITIQDSRGSTPLHLAFRKRNRTLTELLISKQYYYASNPVDSDGLSHFHIACALNKRQIAEDFLDKKIDVKHIIPYDNYQTWYGYSAFKFAIDNQCINVLEYLLNCDALTLETNGLYIMDYAYDNRNQNILNFVISFMEKDMVSIQCPPSVVNSLSSKEVKSTMRRFCVSQYTELHNIAVLQKNKDQVNFILDDCHPPVVIVTDAQGKTPLHLAFETDQGDLVEQFLTLHLEFHENPIDSNNLSHFHISCTIKNESIIEDFIKKGADINMPINLDSLVWAGYTPLHFAMVHGRIKNVELLLHYGADFTVKNTFDISPFDLAIPDFYVAFIINYDDENNGIWYLVEQILLTNQHRKFKNFNDRGITLLHVASAKGDIDMINRHARADTINGTAAEDLVTWAGYTPLHFATLSGQNHAAKVLLNFGADPTIENYDKCVAGHYLYSSDNIDDRLFLIPKIVYNDEGVSIFHSACQSGNVKVLQHFLKIGADVNKRIPHGCNNARHGDEGKTPLHLAVEACRPEIVKFLLKHGADVNARDCHFNTPLHFCTDEDILKILLDHGADPESLNFRLISALEKPLYHYPQPEQITAIIENGGDINKKGLNFIGTLEPTKSIILARHIERLTVLGVDVNERNRNLYDNIITNDDEIRRDSLSYKEKCANELKLMKAMDIDSRTTLYDILLKSSSEMAKYSKNETLQKIMESEQDLRQKYPIYAYLVILQFKKGVKRSVLLKEGKRSLSLLINRWVDELIFEIILDFMNDHEIMYLNYASSGQNIFQ